MSSDKAAAQPTDAEVALTHARSATRPANGVVPRPRSARNLPRVLQRTSSAAADTRVSDYRATDFRIDTVHIDNVPISSASEGQIVDHVMGALDERRGGVIATPNVDIMRGMARGQGADVAHRADLLVADGMPLVWASRLQREPLPGRVTGADLFWSLSDAAAGRGKSVFLLGGAPGVGARAAEALMTQSDGLRVVGATSPGLGFESDQQLMSIVEQELLDASPDLVFVALGFPKQEQVALRLREILPHAWFLGCGGAIDMAAGDRRRAPKIFQTLGLEWVHRLVLEPGRMWRRYLLHDIPFVFGLLGRSARLGLTRRAAYDNSY